MDDELLQSVKALESAGAELPRQAIDHYKESTGFKEGLKRMGRVTYEYGYRVALTCFHSLHPDSEVEEAPFTIWLEDDLIALPGFSWVTPDFAHPRSGRKFHESMMVIYPPCHPSYLVVPRGVLGAVPLEGASTHLAFLPLVSRRLCIGAPAVAFRVSLQCLDLVGEAEKVLSRDNEWCRVGCRWWEPRVGHHLPKVVWSWPGYGDLFRLLRVVRLRAVLRIRVTKWAFFDMGPPSSAKMFVKNLRACPIGAMCASVSAERARLVLARMC
ncbi:hypothetical protein B296_00035745 [Ensete ventricosum]|uniref:Uncharacterized protein n=1 Tax=Ensete ventricosum TaxID=4639 RepID=A0A426XCQ0_ENSVE|nr:hypothetical protein B296_00035745 [Ensete ventricosum]